MAPWGDAEPVLHVTWGGVDLFQFQVVQRLLGSVDLQHKLLPFLVRLVVRLVNDNNAFQSIVGHYIDFVACIDLTLCTVTNTPMLPYVYQFLYLYQTLKSKGHGIKTDNIQLFTFDSWSNLQSKSLSCRVKASRSFSSWVR